MAIEINNINDLIAFSNGDYGRGTSSAYLDVKLMADLDFADYAVENYKWPGCTGTWYCNFDGQGHYIKNIYYNGTADWAFFNTYRGTLQNLNLINILIQSTGKIASLTLSQQNPSTIQYCHISGYLECTGTQEVYGITRDRYASSILNSCSFSGTIKGQVAVGGIQRDGGQVVNCTVAATLNTIKDVYPFGASVGSIVNCLYIGKIILDGSTTTVRTNGVYNGKVINSIIIYKDIEYTTEPSWITSGTVINSLYDSTILEDKQITITTDLTPATTQQLKSEEWLRARGLII